MPLIFIFDVRIQFLPRRSHLVLIGVSLDHHTRFCSVVDKPPIADLQYFLDFQVHKIWAPIHNDLPLGPTPNITTSPYLQPNLMGPKLYVNTTQVNHCYLFNDIILIYSSNLI